MVRAGLDALLAALSRIAAPTGTRGSILLMTGGLIVLGFLFLAFIFRSAIVGDLAPVANARVATRRVMPPPVAPGATSVPVPGRPFETGRAGGPVAGDARSALDAALDEVARRGADARILRSRAGWKIVRVYACSTCAAEGATAHGCEYERGLLAGAFERVGGELAKVHEIACAGRGDAHCDFEVRHAALEAS